MDIDSARSQAGQGRRLLLFGRRRISCHGDGPREPPLPVLGETSPGGGHRRGRRIRSRQPCFPSAAVGAESQSPLVRLLGAALPLRPRGAGPSPGEPLPFPGGSPDSGRRCRRRTEVCPPLPSFRHRAPRPPAAGSVGSHLRHGHLGSPQMPPCPWPETPPGPLRGGCPRLAPTPEGPHRGAAMPRPSPPEAAGCLGEGRGGLCLKLLPGGVPVSRGTETVPETP